MYTFDIEKSDSIVDTGDITDLKMTRLKYSKINEGKAGMTEY